MSDVADAVHHVAVAYGSLDAALDMTPRQLVAAATLESRRRGIEIAELANAARAAQHADKDQYAKFLKGLRDD